MRISQFVSLGVLAVVTAAATPAQAQHGHFKKWFRSGNPNTGVMPIESRLSGKGYGDWGAKWWKWVLDIAPEENPIFDVTGEFADVDQKGKVWFLAGTAGGGPVERTVTIPEKKALFIPIINTVWWAPEDGLTEEELRAGANASIDTVDILEFSLDGEELVDLFTYRADSKKFKFKGGEVFGISGGRDLAVSDGYWIMLAPLSEGEHVIHFRGGISGVFETEVTYFLTVEDDD